MRSKFKYCLIFPIMLLLSSKMQAQLTLSTYIDAGDNNVSEGLYIKSSALGAYQINKFRVEGAAQFDLINAGSNFLTGGSLIVAREFSINKFRFETQGLFMYDPFSSLVHESNWGVLINIPGEHFNYKLGTEFKTYHITNKAENNYDITSNKKLNEKWNLIYLVKYFLKPSDHKWNAGASITNIDHFLINQETNPMVNIEGRCDISSPLTLYVESWYKSAGSLNISANYFGFFFRTGIIWKPDLKK